MIYRSRTLRRRQRTQAALVVCVISGAVLLVLVCGMVGQALI